MHYQVFNCVYSYYTYLYSLCHKEWSQSVIKYNHAIDTLYM